MTGGAQGQRSDESVGIAPWSALLALLICWVVIGWLFRADFAAMLYQWSTSATFSYGFLVLPGAAFLVWQRLGNAPSKSHRPAWVILLPTLGVLLLWIAGRLAGIQAATQLCAVLLLINSFWLILGHRTTWHFAWPLAFLLFMVPEGQFMVPRLMNWTADFTVAAVKISGIPIYRDALQFSIPSGDFAIVEACSGVRFLLASLALGFFMAGALFDSWRRRALLLLFALVMPLVGNGLRAYIIVLVGHLSEMRLVADHILIGQVFFSALFFFMALLAVRYADRPILSGFAPLGFTPADGHATRGVTFAVIAMLSLLLCTTLAHARLQDRLAKRPLGPSPALPQLAGKWAGPDHARNSWQPRYRNPHQQIAGRYGGVDIFVVIYGHQTEDAELVNAQNRLFDGDRWTAYDRRRGRLAGSELRYDQVEVRSGLNKRLLRYWYLLDGQAVLQPQVAKLQELTQLLRRERPTSSLISLGIAFEGNVSQASAALDEFMQVFCKARIEKNQLPPCG